MGKPNIICVDDEIFILNCLKEQLMLNFGSLYNIEIAESGAEALEILAELMAADTEVPLILSDYIMPDMKGDELLKEIRSISPETILVLLTGQATLIGVTNAVNKAGVFRYLEKPWKIEDLSATVSEALAYYYQEIIIERINRQLRGINQHLEQTIEQRSADLAINQQMLDSTDRIQLIRHVVADVIGEINQLLYLMQSGVNEIRGQQQKIINCCPERLEDYLTGVMDFYRRTAEAFDNLIAIFDRDTLQSLFYVDKNNCVAEICATVSSTRHHISESLNQLLNCLNEG